jgi:hypothetical protein
MRKQSILSLLTITAAVITFGLSEARAGFPAPPIPGVNVQVNGYLPAPPGVHVMVDSGRPYYVESDRRVYMERERPYKHYKKQKKHHRDNGNRHGHDRHDHDRHGGRGR